MVSDRDAEAQVSLYERMGGRVVAEARDRIAGADLHKVAYLFG